MSEPGGSLIGWRSWLIFFLLLVGMLLALSTDFRPPPLYDKMRFRGSTLYCTSSAPVVATVKLPQQGVSAVDLAIIVSQPCFLKVTVRNAKNGDVLATQSYRESGYYKLNLQSNRAKKISLHFETDALTEDLAPQLWLSEFPPEWPIQMQAHGQTGFPFLRFHFSWPSRDAVWAWLLVPLTALLCWRRIVSPAFFMVTLGLCTVLLSVLLWQNDYAMLNYNRADADGYGACATHLASYLKDPTGENQKAREFLRAYPHSTNILASAIMAVPIALGLSSRMTYLLFSSLCGFGALGIFASILQKHLRVSLPVLLISLTLFAAHMHHIRAFSRAITDEFGILLVMLLVKLLMDRAEKQTPQQSLIISALALILPLARPQGIALAPIFLFGVVACDAWRERKWNLLQRLQTALTLGIIPLLILVALYLGFDWQHNFKLQLAKAAKSSISSLEFFTIALISTLQWIPVIWLCAKSSLWKRAPVCILLGWGLIYLALLAAVGAPMKSRHFLPLLPLLALTAGALETVRPRLRIAAWSLVGCAIFANVGLIIYQLHFLFNNRKLNAMFGTF